MPREEDRLQRLPLTLLAAALLISSLHAEIRGAARVEKPEPGILAWGTELVLWSPAGERRKTLLANTDFSSGGCVADVDGDGRDDLLTREHPGVSRFVWLKAPEWRSRVIDSATDFRDCLPVGWFGQRGVVIPHLHAQLRFYEFPSLQSHDFYSIYTPSEQGGLLAHDVDGDGFEDLFVGNYWVKNPGKPGVTWRLFAINLFHEGPKSAAAKLALDPETGSLIWAESEGAPARIVRFERPADPRRLWIEKKIDIRVNRPGALLVRPEGIWIGHEGGVALVRKGGTITSITTGRVVGLFEWQGKVIAATSEGLQVVYPPTAAP